MQCRRRQGGSTSPHRRSGHIGVRSFLIALAAVTCILAGPAAVSAAAQAPVNNLAPEVVGFPQVGETLVCGVGSWSGTVSGFSYQWLRDGIRVSSGPFVFSYRVTAADKGHSIWCIVTATGSEGSTEAESANSVAIPGGPGGKAPEPPANIVSPEASGIPAVGERISCSPGTWSGSPAPAFAYQWLRDGSIIPLATANTYVVVEADAGHSLSCRVTATNSAGSASRPSANSLPVPGATPRENVAPEVLGIEPSAVGESLTCSPGSWGGNPAFTFQWVRDSGLPDETILAGATGSIYTPEPADQGHVLSCVVTATNSVGSSEAPSANSLRVRGSRPEDIATPHVSGAPAVGEALSCEAGTWSGVPAPTYAYQWVRNQGMPGEEAIGSATSSTYTPTTEDVGHALSCEVTASNSEGSSSEDSQRVVVPAGAGGTPPEDTAAPEVTGTPAVGEPLRCSEGSWTGSPAPTVSYQWLRDSSVIAGATSSTYFVTEADRGHSLSCEVTAINEEGVASKEGNALQIPGLQPEDIEAPQVAGSPAVGQVLTCLRGRWNGAPPPAFTYEWLRDGTSIPLATAASHTVVYEDRAESISCRVIAQNSAGTVGATSTNSVEVPGGQPENIEAPEASGTPAVGEVLTCSQGTWNGQPAPTYTYQWLLDGVEIPSATANTYTVGSADRGLVLSCRVTASNREGTESADSRVLAIPGIQPKDIEAPSVSGTATVGQSLTCERGIWSGAPPPTFTYQWLRDGMSIPSATESTYTVSLADQGHLLSCDVTATNTAGSAEAPSSNGTAIFRKAATTASVPELTFPPPPVVEPVPTSAQVLATLRGQLTLAQRRASLTSVRKTGLFAFSFQAPGQGTLEFSWYQAPTGAQHASAKTKPPVLAQLKTTFSRAATKTVKLRLTTAGRRLISHGSWVKLTVEGTFARAHMRTVTWLETVVLNH